MLALYAVTNTKGRKYQEPAPKDRSEFQRDRARIIHSTAFRRLEYKTQVFVNHASDLYRTRLTHSIEVAQIARSIARNLQLNEDLTETIALAHDLGHTPFGHTGQNKLNQLMQDYGGFEHNFQSLRIVEKLEENYAGFPGLNLCFETTEGILKHCSTQNALKLGELGNRFLHNKRPSLEAQLVNIADSLAYNSHDVDDGLRSGLITLEQILEHSLFKECFDKIKKKYPETNQRIVIHETIRMLISLQIQDLFKTTEQNIAANNLRSVEDVRNANYLVSFSDSMLLSHKNLKKLLNKNLYQHPKINAMASEAKIIIEYLFNFYQNNPHKLPPNKYGKIDLKTPNKANRAIADYIAGMTDRFAQKTWQELN